MSTPAAAQAETAAPAAPEGLPANASEAANKFVSGQEAKAKEKATAEAPKPEPAKREPQKPRIDPNLIKREREATEALRRANDIEQNLKPLQEALVKKDIRGAMRIMAAKHGVTFADFVEVLKSSGDDDETVEQKAERVAREVLQKTRAAEQAAEAEAKKAREAEEAKGHETRIASFRERIQKQAESDPQRWPTASIQGTGSKAWEALVAFDEAGIRFGEDPNTVGLDVVEEAHDLVKAHFAAKRERLDMDKAIRLVVGELAKLGAQGARDKLKESRNPSAAGNARNEAGGEQRNSGRAEEPRINNRTASGAPGVVPKRDENAPVTWGKAAVDDVLKRLPSLAARVS
jgi:hypothetical protein